MLRKVEREELKKALEQRTGSEQLDFSDCLFVDMDLSEWDLSNINFDRSDFRKVNLSGANLSGCTTRNTYFQTSVLKNIDFQNADISSGDFRYCDLSGANISGANVYSAAFQGANLNGIIADENTQYFYPRCPMEGAFIGWKVCFGRRIVQLLIPRDARRLQGTRHEIRVDKAYVLSVRNADYTEEYEEAHAYVDENFVYRKAHWVTVDAYDTDRFTDSGAGIHIWMDRDAAIAYLG